MKRTDIEKFNEYILNEKLEKLICEKTTRMDNLNDNVMQRLKKVISKSLPLYEEMKSQRKIIRRNLYNHNKVVKSWKTRHQNASKLRRKEYLKLRYHRLKENEKQRRIKNGDTPGYYIVYIVKNGKKWKHVKTVQWYYDAYNLFKESIKQNREEVLVNSNFYKTKFKVGSDEQITYEILIAKQIDPKKEENFTYLPNKYGKLCKVQVSDRNDFIIIKRDDWWIPVKYVVSGFNQYTDKKTGMWIARNLFNPKNDKFNITFVSTYNSTLFIKNNNYLFYVRGGNRRECTRLYISLMSYFEKNENIQFIGELKGFIAYKTINKACEIYNKSSEYFNV